MVPSQTDRPSSELGGRLSGSTQRSCLMHSCSASLKRYAEFMSENVQSSMCTMDYNEELTPTPSIVSKVDPVYRAAHF